MTTQIKWSAYEKKVRKVFDQFMAQVQIGDVVTIFHGNDLCIDKAKVLGVQVKDYDLGTKDNPNIKPTTHLILQPQYGAQFDQPILTEGAKTPWFDGDYIIHREFRFKSQ